MQRRNTMPNNQSWSIEHIQHILSSLDKNHITIPINTNGFEETRASASIYNMPDDPYSDFDDFGLQQQVERVKQESPIANCLLALVRCLMQNVNLTDTKAFIRTLKMYIDATLVKDLHITKYKLTKKKLKEELDTIDTNLDNNAWVKDNYGSVSKSLLVSFSRCYGCNIHIEGLCEMHIEYVSANTNIHLKLTEGSCTCEVS